MSNTRVVHTRRDIWPRRWGGVETLRQLLGLKNLVHRDRAADLFVDHIRAESERLKERISSGLALLCERQSKAPALEAILSRPWVKYQRAAFGVSSKTLLEAHCYAIASVCGLEAIRAHIDPSSQTSPMLWSSHRLIAAGDVGEENVGHAPSPQPMPGMHVLYRPGSFKGGISSQQHTLVQRYQCLHSVSEKVVMLLLSLRVIEPDRGVGKAIYSEQEIGPGIFGRNRIATLEPAPHPVDEWEADIVITDADAALSDVPKQGVKQIHKAIEDIDPFWPAFCGRHRLTW